VLQPLLAGWYEPIEWIGAVLFMGICLLATIHPIVRAVKLRRLDGDASHTEVSAASKMDIVYRKSIELADAQLWTDRNPSTSEVCKKVDPLADDTDGVNDDNSSARASNPSYPRSTASSRPISSIHTAGAWSGVSASATLTHASDHDSDTQSLPRYTHRHSKVSEDEIAPC
jgi:hypothetical protein